jgi:hypothetical protein
MKEKRQKTNIDVPRHSEQAVKEIKERYPELSLPKIAKALMNLGADNFKTDPEAIKDAILRA